MKWLKLTRTFKEGWHNFRRNGWLTFATVTVIVVSLYILSMTAIIGVASYAALTNVQSRVNISMYFNPEVSQQDIFTIKSDLEKYQEVKSIRYVSRDDALKEFLETEGDDPAITQALTEIGENPLLASLVIQAQKPEQYDTIDRALAQASFRDKISRINYGKNKEIIDRLQGVLRMMRAVGLALGLVFTFIAILITFNTIRISMYAHRQEFEVMRLVGASNMYVRMPSVFEGVFYGFFAALVTMIFLGVSAYAVNAFTRGVLQQSSLSFYGHYFFFIFIGVIVIGVTLGVVSSFIAIRRYLERN
ncbi:MAG TPA: permease-like cell division protein FtsX [Patescibacteria group bacterium]|nr:permease-like cell division protein FtsX [Patescibacteria group bacterium]